MVHECSKLIIIYGLAGCETGKMNGLDGFFFNYYWHCCQL